MVREYTSTSEYFINNIRQLLNEISGSDNSDDIVSLLTAMQDYAIKLGTMIENRIGEGTSAVSKLEELCEIIYVMSEGIYRDNCRDEYQCINNLINEINILVKKLELRKEVVFFPYRYVYWNLIESVWQKYSEEDNTDVYVVPIPYYDKKPDGEFGKCHYEGEKFSNDVNVVDYREYRSEKRFPDVIILQNVQENTNYALSVEKDYYAENLKPYTPNLIYISPFIINNIASGDERGRYGLKFYVTVPGMVYTDKIIVESLDMRNIYINELTAFLGEETRGIWKERVDTFSSLINAQDKMLSAKGNIDIDKKSEYSSIVFNKKDGKKKKTLLFVTSISTLMQYKEMAIKKLISVVKTFENNKEEVAVIWRTDEEINRIDEYDHELWIRFMDVVENFKESGIGIYEETGSDLSAVDIADAYYGDPSVMATKMRRLSKPVMIMNVLV